MRVVQAGWRPESGWAPLGVDEALPQAQLALVFAGGRLLEDPVLQHELRRRFPQAHLLGCSTAGEILGEEVRDDSVSIAAAHFEHSTLRAASASLAEHGGSSLQIGRALATRLAREGLVHVFVLSDGLDVNGSELARGLASGLPGVPMTGGLSGDGERFDQTWVQLGADLGRGRVAVVGLYGERLRVGMGCLGGWDPFGPERLVTRSEGNVLYELDGRSALDLYKRYLGEDSADLPSSGLLYPLALRSQEGGPALVRTILSVSEEDRSLTFAGDIPQGSYARLMKANFDRLVDGAQGAAEASSLRLDDHPADLAVLISCVGRKLILRQRIEEEIEAVRDVLGPQAALTGFYSYGEISPVHAGAPCDLHNQTMTITTLTEV
jgi:hypothetical protein